MTKTHSRARVRLISQAEVMEFVGELARHADRFSIENFSGMHRVNAKSVIGVMYTMFDFPEEMFLVNDDHDGVIPRAMDKYRVVSA